MHTSLGTCSVSDVSAAQCSVSFWRTFAHNCQHASCPPGEPLHLNLHKQCHHQRPTICHLNLPWCLKMERNTEWWHSWTCCIHPIRDGLNLARATHDFAPHRDEFCLVHPKLSTQNSNAIKIKGSDVFQGGFNAINSRKCKDPPDSTDPNFHSTLVHSHLTSALRFPLTRSLCHSVAVRFECD